MEAEAEAAPSAEITGRAAIGIRHLTNHTRIDMDNATKELIVDRLHDLVGVCPTCGKHKCGHGSSSELPDSISTDLVLRAINLDEHFFKEPVPDKD